MNIIRSYSNFKPDHTYTVTPATTISHQSGERIELIGKIARFARVAFTCAAVAAGGIAALHLGLLPWIVVSASLFALSFLVWKVTQNAINRQAFVQFLGGAEKFNKIPMYQGEAFSIGAKFENWERLEDIHPEYQTTWMLKSDLNPHILQQPLSLAKMDNGRIIAIMQGKVGSGPENDPGQSVEIVSEDGGSTYGAHTLYNSFRIFETMRGLPVIKKLLGCNDKPSEVGTKESVRFVRCRDICLGQNAFS